MLAGKRLRKELGQHQKEGAAIVGLHGLGGEGKLRDADFAVRSLVDFSRH